MIREGREPQEARINRVRHLVVEAGRGRDGTVLRTACGLTASNVVDDLVSTATSDCPDCVRQGMGR